MHAMLRIEVFLSFEAFGLRIFDAADAECGGGDAFIWFSFLIKDFACNETHRRR